MKTITILKPIKTTASQTVFFAIVVFLFISIFGDSARAQIKVLDYGFEDWTGDADTTLGYPFGEYDLDRWNNHKDRTEVLSNCNTWQAYEGDYFLYGNWYVIPDDCLQDTAGSPHLHLGGNYAFGNNAEFDLESSVPGNELYVRYKVRLGDGWKTNTNHMVKFLRVKWVGGGYADYYSNLIMYSGEGNYITAPGADESAWSGLFHLNDIGIDFSDGAWHDFACWLDISDLHNTVPGSLKVKVWVDSILIIDREVPVNAEYVLENRPVGFDRMMFLENFCGTTNTGPVTFGYDNLEVWDGVPGTTGSTFPTLSIISNFVLQQNYPNPFNPSTTIKYSLAKPCNVQIKIYNQLGQEIRMLINEQKPAGEYNVTWDTRDAKGNKLASGVYFYRLTAGKQVDTKKMLYLR